MISVGMALELKPGCYDEYKKRHDELCPELAAVMSQNRIDMVIYRFDDLLFVYGTAPSQEAWDAVENDPVTPRWNEHMAEVLKSDEKGELIVYDLPQAFCFGNLK